MSKRRESDDRPPARRKRPLPAWALALVVAVPVLVCGGGGVAAIAALSAVSRAARDAQMRRPENTVKMPVADLIAEWKRNPLAAAQKYQDVAVEIDGVVAEISSNLSGQSYINLNVDDRRSGGTHIFAIDESVRRELAAVRVGDHVVVVATATGESHNMPWLVAHSIKR